MKRDEAVQDRKFITQQDFKDVAISLELRGGLVDV